jgi:hypothetical protein
MGEVSGQLPVCLRKVRRTEWKRIVYNVCQAATNLENRGQVQDGNFCLEERSKRRDRKNERKKKKERRKEGKEGKEKKRKEEKTKQNKK